MYKKRGYKREIPLTLDRDYKLFAIACEGSKREPDYFNVFQYISTKIKVDVIESVVSDEEMGNKHENKSAPLWVLDRAITYIKKEGLSDEDDLWFVLDKDRWSEEQLRLIAQYCKDYPNWHIVISNPCFEVWLYFHKKADISISTSNTCSDFKYEISTLERGGYHPYKFIPSFENAIANAKAGDTDKDHFLPRNKETKVYQLGEALMEIIGKKDFDDFINKGLKQLVKINIDRAKSSSSRKGKN